MTNRFFAGQTNYIEEMNALDGETGDHIADATGAHAATAISNTPAGNIAATTVQAAINELDTEKLSASATTLPASFTASSLTSVGTLGSLAVSGTARVGDTPTTNPLAKLFVQADVDNAANFGAQCNTNSVGGSNIVLRKSRGTNAAEAVVQSGDLLGALAAFGFDGAAYIRAAEIRMDVDGTPGTNDMPGRIVFSTTADGASGVTERMRIDNAGVITMGAAPGTESVRITPPAVLTGQYLHFTRNAAINEQQVQAAGTANLGLVSTGGGVINLYTGTGFKQVTIADTASATRALTLTGSNGGNPAIGTSAGSVQFTAIPIPPSYTVSTLPAAGTAGGQIYVSNESGGAVLAFSDATNWRRVTDRAIVS